VPLGCLKPRELPVKAVESPDAAHTGEPPRLQGICAPTRKHTLCLPCRRSRVRIPSAALGKACICRPFLRAQSACASASGRTDSGLAAGRSSAVPRKPPCLQADSGSSEPKSFCRPAEGRPYQSCASAATRNAYGRCRCSGPAGCGSAAWRLIDQWIAGQAVVPSDDLRCSDDLSGARSSVRWRPGLARERGGQLAARVDIELAVCV